MDLDYSYYWARYFYDLTFFIIILVLIFNLVVAIIIDAFTDIREKEKFVTHDIKEKCFICGISKEEF